MMKILWDLFQQVYIHILSPSFNTFSCLFMYLHICIYTYLYNIHINMYFFILFYFLFIYFFYFHFFIFFLIQNCLVRLNLQCPVSISEYQGIQEMWLNLCMNIHTYNSIYFISFYFIIFTFYSQFIFIFIPFIFIINLLFSIIFHIFFIYFIFLEKRTEVRESFSQKLIVWNGKICKYIYINKLCMFICV
jgi:hypothetical protein